MLLGVLIASQLNFWEMNGKFLEWITLGWFKADTASHIKRAPVRAKKPAPNMVALAKTNI